MGQSTNYLLGGQQQLMGADPETYRQQLLQQEQAKIQAVAPQNQLAAQLGSLFGRGITNVAQDRGFFEVTNPVLQKLTKIQGVYDSSVQASDPNDPMSLFNNLQTNFAKEGLGIQALMAKMEGQKYSGVELKNKTAEAEYFAKNPAAITQEIAKAAEAGNQGKVDELTSLQKQITDQQELVRRKTLAEITHYGAQDATQRALANKYNSEIQRGRIDVRSIPDKDGGATIVYYDLDKRQVVDKVTVTNEAIANYLNKDKDKAGAGKKELTQEDANARLLGVKPGTPAAQPAAQSTSTSPSVSKPTSSVPDSASASGAWNDTTKTYDITKDPDMQNIQMVAAQNANRLATDPQFAGAIVKAQNDVIARIKQTYGNGINISY